jgi:hypothetical protein
MEKVALDRLSLEDLGGNPVRLLDLVDRYLLVIFLRHLA